MSKFYEHTLKLYIVVGIHRLFQVRFKLNVSYGEILQGIVVNGITYWLQVWAIEKKGPVFTAMFTPLALIITAIFSTFIWKETLYWGRFKSQTSFH